MVALAFVSCRKQLSDEELFDRLHGNWGATMKVMEYESFHYEVDSALFHTEGRRLGIVFSSKGNFQKTFEDFCFGIPARKDSLRRRGGLFSSVGPRSNFSIPRDLYNTFRIRP